MTLSVLDIFKIGIGPSSSHTVGPMKAAYRFVEILQERALLERVTGISVDLYGSLALTGKGHGTDRAILLGLEGHSPEDISPQQIEPILERVRSRNRLRLLGAADEIAFDEAQSLHYLREEVLPGHSNGMRFIAQDAETVLAQESPEAVPHSAHRDQGGGAVNVMEWVSAFTLAVNEENAAGGRVVTAPTNGAAGIIPAVLHYYIRFEPGADEQGVVRFLLIAGAIAMLYKQNASLSAAEMGCQGEVGVACSMAAAGLAAALHGTNEQIENAAEIGMERGDGRHRVTLDQVIETMRQTGRDMSSIYKETSQGGLAVNVPEC